MLNFKYVCNIEQSRNTKYRFDFNHPLIKLCADWESSAVCRSVEKKSMLKG